LFIVVLFVYCGIICLLWYYLFIVVLFVYFIYKMPTVCIRVLFEIFKSIYFLFVVKTIQDKQHHSTFCVFQLYRGG
jgi:hypothetical protein